MSRMVGVSSYPARKSLMGMDSPVRGEAKMRARDTRGTKRHHTFLQHPLALAAAGQTPAEQGKGHGAKASAL